MKFSRMTSAGSLVVAAGLIAGAAAFAAPANADTTSDDFLAALSDAGLGNIDPANAVDVGQSICPMLAQPGQNTADAAAKVADAIGRPLGPATMFTGIAISMFCPGAVASLADGRSPIPLTLLGI
jgi:hypothetical protein